MLSACHKKHKAWQRIFASQDPEAITAQKMQSNRGKYATLTIPEKLQLFNQHLYSKV